MKLKTGNKLKLGVFIIIGLLFFIVGIYFVGKKQNLFDNTFGISTVFRDVSGLQIGNNVRFGGINVGIIENISIKNDTSIRVDMQIQEDVHRFIKVDSRAIIGSEGIMGNKILVLTPGTSPNVIKKNTVIASSAAVSLDDILKNVRVTSENTADITDDLAEIVHYIRTGQGTIGKLFMDSAFAEDIDRTVGNVRKGTKGFQENMEAAKSNVLLRGYFRRKEKQKEKEQKELQQEKQSQTQQKSSTQVKPEKQDQDTTATKKKKKFLVF